MRSFVDASKPFKLCPVCRKAWASGGRWIARRRSDVCDCGRSLELSDSIPGGFSVFAWPLVRWMPISKEVA